MTIDIAALIAQRPHLKDPLELYARWQEFQRQAAPLLPLERAALTVADGRAYPREIAPALCELFASTFQLPSADLTPLSKALAAGEIDFMKLPLGEIPSLPGLDMNEESLARLLFLLSRPYFLTLRHSFPLDGGEWQEGRCPLCSARPALSSIIEGPKRLLHCSYCATSGPYRFIGCPSCGCVDTDKLGAVLSEDEPGFRVATCDACHSYVKVAENSILSQMTLDLADLASLPLDIIAQSKGYSRLAPNPVSLWKME
jgi:FdhE protein